MSNIVFSKLTRKQVIESYNNKEYKKMIQMLINVFSKHYNFERYINNNKNNLEHEELINLRIILHIWKVKDEFKTLLNGGTNYSNVYYQNDLDKDYIKHFFSKEEIDEIKEKYEKSFYDLKNKMIISNYKMGNIRYVVDSLKFDYKNHADYETNLSKISYNKNDLNILREISHLYNHMNFDLTKDQMTMYYYSLLKNLLSIYNNLNSDYLVRFIKRQMSLDIDLKMVLKAPYLLNMFSKCEKIILNDIYDKYIKDGIQVSKCFKMYENEFAGGMHMALLILELPGSLEEKYHKMRNDYDFKPNVVKRCLESRSLQRDLQKDKLDLFKKICFEYSEYYQKEEEKELYKKQLEQALKVGKVVEILIKEEIDLDDFFNQSKQLKKEYDQIIDYIKKYCKETYNMYLTYKATKNELYNQKLICDANKIITSLTENSSFDEVDYFMITDIPYSEMISYLKEHSHENYVKLSQSLKNTIAEPVLYDNDLNDIYDMTIKLAVPKDNKVQYFEVTKEDKKKVIEFLSEIKAPITSKNIMCGLRKYLSGQIIINDDKGYQKRITHKNKIL